MYNRKVRGGVGRKAVALGKLKKEVTAKEYTYMIWLTEEHTKYGGLRPHGERPVREP